MLILYYYSIFSAAAIFFFTYIVYKKNPENFFPYIKDIVYMIYLCGNIDYLFNIGYIILYFLFLYDTIKRTVETGHTKKEIRIAHG